MSEQPPLASISAKRRAPYWIPLIRSVLAMVLGLALLLQPDKARPMFLNFMGLFWLTAGIMNLRWGSNGERARRPSVVIGLVGIVAGALVLGRFLLIQVIGQELIVLVLGITIVLTGLVHVFEGVRTGAGSQRQRSWTSTALGAFEVVLGLVVLIWRDEFGATFYVVVTVWAFVAAFVLLSEALRQRARGKLQAG
jgi:uncharacterized membrane protein HdeD (DUF308 family)